ncbi:uncharacterized protein LACBIDRAFT_323941 [Laccaria bicolor S238N-H82]|uniref:Predicted protein n=1 Tax=Laccaria bicolor (strain S238N-H82 / ATCC MYA-4686) TaxID=486041 RepID=B0D042_LACBS|nr:uncharacterized protein LACBIDRAFT_323941 [Laccaria bicolor S238N-H82]EDR11762.1 predicted protein [Laccaria bicolor S238N-H82]|eukprot:XP_001877659.1 predicted protein [Laccaria bicolor S238N-H82]
MWFNMRNPTNFILSRIPKFIAPPLESYPTLSSSHQLDSSLAADTAFEIDITTNSQETESTPRPSLPMRQGMENGYSLSPVYSLWLEYCSEGESSKSTQSQVVFYATKPSLARDEVVDRGKDTSTERYMVHKPLLEQICLTVNELQVFIQHMAGLIEERDKFFQVDPEDTLLKVLGGAETTSQLHAAWLCLTSRLSAAQKFMFKYQQEYQNIPVPPSPVSTNPDIHRYIASLPDIDDKLRHIHGTIPCHVNKLPRNTHQRLMETKEKWEAIIPIPPWLATPTQKSSSPISDISARTSYKAASTFTLPDRVEQSTMATVQKKQSSTPWKGSKGVQFASQANILEPSQSSALMSSGTPFKPSKGLFLQEDGNNPGPFPQSGPNCSVSADNFLYGTDEIPVFSLDGIQFSGFNYPLNANATPSGPSTQPVTSTPWNPNSGQTQSFHSMFSQGREGTLTAQGENLQATTQVNTSRVVTGNAANVQQSERVNQNQEDTNPTHDCSSNCGQQGFPGGDDSDPPDDDDDPPKNQGNNNTSRKDDRQVSHHRTGFRGGRGGGPPSPPSSSSTPYGDFIPTVRTDIKLDQLPTWDGNHTTAINYFWKIQQLAAMKGYLPQALGYWLWMNLKEDSTVPGHENEDSGKFIIWHIMYTWMLVNGDMGGPLEVFLVMQRAPISWGPVINIDSIRSSSMLFSKVTEHSQALVHATKMENSQIVTADNLAYMLRRLGISWPSDRSSPSPARFNKRVNVTELKANTSEDPPKSSSIPSPIDDGILKEVYQVLLKKQRPPPQGGYPFKRNDHVSTKMGWLPPSPCKVCGSPNHWDKECPDWNVYLETRNRSAHFTGGQSEDEPELEEKYCAAYAILLNNRVAEQLLKLQESSPFTEDQDFDQAAVMSLVRQLNYHSHGHKTYERRRASVEETLDVDMELAKSKQKLDNGTHILEHVSESLDTPPAASRPSRPPSVVEVEDKDNATARSKPKSVDPQHILEVVDDSKSAEPPPILCDSFSFENSNAAYNMHGLNDDNQQQEDTPNPDKTFTLPFLNIPGPPAPLARVRLPKARITKPGASAVGVSVLSTRGRLAATHNKEIDLQLDSCADITLISEEFYLSLKDRPPLQQGYQMQIFQLMETGTHIKGFVRIPVFMQATDGMTIETEAEAYVVPNMTVPILLGEDFHLTYEIQVSRSVMEGSFLNFRGSPYTVPAVGVNRTNDFEWLRKSAHHISSFVKAKMHKQAKAKCQRKKRQAKEDAHLIKAAQDYHIRPHESCWVQVIGHFKEERDWFVEKNMLSCGNDNVLLVPNMLISSKDPYIPVANPSSQPHFIRKGEVLATISNPAKYFDTPHDTDQWHEMSKKAEALAAIIAATSEEDQVEAEEYGPKTAAMPDPTVYPSSQMKDLVDVGSLPEHLHNEAWRMLSSHEKAFGFDSRLAKPNTKWAIWDVDACSCSISPRESSYAWNATTHPLSHQQKPAWDDGNVPDYVLFSQHWAPSWSWKPERWFWILEALWNDDLEHIRAVSRPEPDVVFESPVRSGYWVPRGSNRDRDRQILSVFDVLKCVLKVYNRAGYNRLFNGERAEKAETQLAELAAKHAADYLLLVNKISELENKVASPILSGAGSTGTKTAKKPPP